MTRLSELLTHSSRCFPLALSRLSASPSTRSTRQRGTSSIDARLNLSKVRNLAPKRDKLRRGVVSFSKEWCPSFNNLGPRSLRRRLTRLCPPIFISDSPVYTLIDPENVARARQSRLSHPIHLAESPSSPFVPRDLPRPSPARERGDSPAKRVCCPHRRGQTDCTSAAPSCSRVKFWLVPRPPRPRTKMERSRLRSTPRSRAPCTFNLSSRSIAASGRAAAVAGSNRNADFSVNSRSILGRSRRMSVTSPRRSATA